MTELMPELDKLRNKELSFGCYISYSENWHNYVEKIIFHDDFPHVFDWVDDLYCTDSDYTIIWHPLTRWRICYLHQSLQKRDDWYDHPDLSEKHPNTLLEGMYYLFDTYGLYDQNELQRMQYEKRPELKELLIQFSNYL